MTKKVQWVQQLLKMSSQDRIKQLSKDKRTKKTKRNPQYFLKKQNRLQSPSYIIQICETNEIYTLHQLKEYNKTHEQKVSLVSIQYWYGNWKAFKRRLVPKPSKNLKYVQSQIIDLCVRFNIKTISDFQQFHKKQPTILPSSDWIERHFGKWKYFKKILQACSVQSTLQKYIDLKMRLGRYPSKLQCQKNNIQLQLLFSVWQPVQLKDTVQLLQRIYKNAKK